MSLSPYVIHFPERPTAQIIPFKARPIRDDRRQRISETLTKAAMNCASDQMSEVWMRKARAAVYMPSAFLTAKPKAALVDFTPDGFDPRPDTKTRFPWLLFCGLVTLAMAVTPMGWLP